MKLKKYRPITPGTRQLIINDKSMLWKGDPIKKLTVNKESKGSRNNMGRITVRGRSKGLKKRFRIIDFSKRQHGVYIIIRIEYDPNRSSHIALVKSESKRNLHYIIATNKMKINSRIEISNKQDIRIGNCMILKNIPIGVHINNLELDPNKGSQIARSAGSSAMIVSKKNDKIYVKLNSGEIKIFNQLCKATIGTVSNIENKNIKFGKAGRKIWIGKKSRVRGVAKNPIDHPHGGGEGKTSGGRHPVTPWGKPTKGYKNNRKK